MSLSASVSSIHCTNTQLYISQKWGSIVFMTSSAASVKIQCAKVVQYMDAILTNTKFIYWSGKENIHEWHKGNECKMTQDYTAGLSLTKRFCLHN